MINDWLLISLKDLNIQGTVAIKIIVLIKLCLVCERTTPSRGWITLTQFLACDLTLPNCFDNPKLTLLGRYFVVKPDFPELELSIQVLV